MPSINDFILQDEIKKPKLLLCWLLIIGFIILSLIGMNSIFKFNHYYLASGIVKGEYLSLYVPTKEVDKIINSDYIYLNDDKYKYQVIKISDNIIENNLAYYQEVLIDVDLHNKSFINNQIIEAKFILESETMFQYFINFAKGE